MELVKITSTWCPSCIIMNNVYNKISDKYKQLSITSYDYDFDDVEKYNVGKILPVLIIYKNNVEIKRIIGEASFKEIDKIIGDLL